MKKKQINISILKHLFDDLGYAEFDKELFNELERYDLGIEEQKYLFIENHIKPYYDKSSDFVKEQIRLALIFNIDYEVIDYEDIQDSNEYYKKMPDNQKDFSKLILKKLSENIEEINLEDYEIINDSVKASWLFSGIIKK